MSDKATTLRRIKSTTGLLAAVLAASIAVACSGSPSSSSGASVTCTSYPLQGAGKYQAEVRVQVSVSNNTSAPANYLADVILTGAGSAAGSGGDTHVLVSGLVPAGTSGTLSRKVLTLGKTQHCEIARLSRT